MCGFEMYSSSTFAFSYLITSTYWFHFLFRGITQTYHILLDVEQLPFKSQVQSYKYRVTNDRICFDLAGIMLHCDLGRLITEFALT